MRWRRYARGVFDHVTLRASDRAATERFYATVLPTLGIEGSYRLEHATAYGAFELEIAQATAERPTSTGVHLGLRAPSSTAVDAFWAAGVDAGYRSDGEPGSRPQYAEDYYGAFLLDPDGNSIEAVRHGRLRERGLIDHIWLRTRDVGAQRAAWSLTARHAGLAITADSSERFRIRGPRGGSLTFVAGDAASESVGVHIAVPAHRGQIDAWHAEMVDAGYLSDGGPGLRHAYHADYYGAFVLDPDGHSLELVDHAGRLGERW